MKAKYLTSVALPSLLIVCSVAMSGPLDPECSAAKTAKSAAMKSTVGVGGRCKPADAAKDAVGLDDKKGKNGKKGKEDKDGMFSKDDSDDKKDNKNKKEDKDGFGLKKKAVKTVL